MSERLFGQAEDPQIIEEAKRLRQEKKTSWPKAIATSLIIRTFTKLTGLTASSDKAKIIVGYISALSVIGETEEFIKTGDILSPDDKAALEEIEEEFEIEADPLLEAKNVVEEAHHAHLLKKDNSGITLLKTALFQGSVASSSQREALKRAGATIEKPEDLFTEEVVNSSTPFFKGGIAGVLDFIRIAQKIQFEAI